MIVAVTGGKGGVGKSTVSLNLGRELDGVVVDADLATADLPRGRGPDLHAVLAGRADPTDAVDRIGSIRVLPCGRTLAGARASDLRELPRVVDRLERECGRVVVDCPAGLARDVGISLSSAHLAVFVTTSSEAALADALRVRDVAIDLEAPVASVVLNRVADPAAGLASRVEREFGATTAVIEEHPAIDDAMQRGRPVRDVHPRCPAIDAFETVGNAVNRCDERRASRSGVR